MSNPFSNMTAEEMERLRLQEPEKFAALERQLDTPEVDRRKGVVFKNGVLVAQPLGQQRPE
jgi:hypothetical protein